MKALVLFLLIAVTSCGHVKSTYERCKDPVIAQATVEALPRIAQAIACSSAEDKPACLKAHAHDLAIETGRDVLQCGLAQIKARADEAAAENTDGGE